MNNEAPISINFRVKSPGGFEYQITLRKGVAAEDFSELMTLIEEKEGTLLKKKFEPVASFGKRATRSVEYIEGRVCQNDGARLIKGVGKIAEKCENYKYDYITKKNTGTCNYIKWVE